MKEKPKSISDYTDRELLERIAINSKEAANSASWTKNYIVITSIITIVLILIGYLSK